MKTLLDKTPLLSYCCYLNITQGGLDNLKIKINNSSGIVYVLMHPFNLTKLEVEGRLGNQIFNLIKKRLLALCLDKKYSISQKKMTPLFIFASHDELDKYKEICLSILKGYLKNSDFDPNMVLNLEELGIYILPTEHDRGVPYFTPEITNDKVKWDFLVLLFRELGIKTIVVSGGYIGWWYSQNLISRCLGSFIRENSLFFKVLISNAAAYKDIVNRDMLIDLGYIKSKKTKEN
jgi:hypothetical protein